MSRVTEAHLAARRQDILDAAARVFADRGFASATIAEIADEAGLSAGAIYRYFDSKQALARACFQEGAGQIAEAWRARVDGAADAREAFYGIASNSFEEIDSEDSEGRTRILVERFLEAARAQSDDLGVCQGEYETLVGGLEHALERMARARQLPDGADCRGLAEALYAFWLGARVARLINPASDVARQLAAVQHLMDAAAGGAQPGM